MVSYPPSGRRTVEEQERREERLLIERRTALLRPDNLDLDTLDERARAVLNLVERDERVILD